MDSSSSDNEASTSQSTSDARGTEKSGKTSDPKHERSLGMGENEQCQRAFIASSVATMSAAEANSAAETAATEYPGSSTAQATAVAAIKADTTAIVARQAASAACAYESPLLFSQLTKPKSPILHSLLTTNDPDENLRETKSEKSSRKQSADKTPTDMPRGRTGGDLSQGESSGNAEVKKRNLDESSKNKEPTQNRAIIAILEAPSPGKSPKGEGSSTASDDPTASCTSPTKKQKISSIRAPTTSPNTSKEKKSWYSSDSDS